MTRTTYTLQLEVTLEMNGGGKAYTAEELADDLRDRVFHAVRYGQPFDVAVMTFAAEPHDDGERAPLDDDDEQLGSGDQDWERPDAGELPAPVPASEAVERFIGDEPALALLARRDWTFALSSYSDADQLTGPYSSAVEASHDAGVICRAQPGIQFALLQRPRGNTDMPWRSLSGDGLDAVLRRWSE